MWSVKWQQVTRSFGSFKPVSSPLISKSFFMNLSPKSSFASSNNSFSSLTGAGRLAVSRGSSAQILLRSRNYTSHGQPRVASISPSSFSSSAVTCISPSVGLMQNIQISGMRFGSTFRQRVSQFLRSRTPLATSVKVVGGVAVVVGGVYFLFKFLFSLIKFVIVAGLGIAGIWYGVRRYRQNKFKTFFYDAMSVLQQRRNLIEGIMDQKLDFTPEKYFRKVSFRQFVEKGPQDKILSRGVEFRIPLRSDQLIGFLMFRGIVKADDVVKLENISYRYVIPNSGQMMKEVLEVYKAPFAEAVVLEEDKQSEKLPPSQKPKPQRMVVEEAEIVQSFEKKTSSKK